MAAIREIIPDAELVQTEDLACIHSTPTLSYQARFENERRWLTFDLLTGRVTPKHRLWWYFRRSARVVDSLNAIAAHAQDPAVWPAVLGVNHYLTSERFLDERIGSYPAHLRGGNGRHRYVDVEAVRVLSEGPRGPAELLKQTWERYRIPIAVTEAHLACTREQQMLWLQEMWNAANQARTKGADVVAVTAWSAFGAFDWRTLLTVEEGSYESGLYDVRAPQPRRTALVPMVRALATAQTYDHPALDARPWWKRDDRILYPRPHRFAGDTDADIDAVIRESTTSRGRPLLITGARGTLGRAFVLLAEERGLHAIARSRRDLDISDRDRVRAQLDAVRPWAVINAAGWVRVDDAELDVDACMRANTVASEILAQECADRGIALVTFSSDLVFGGDESRPYVESDATTPLNVYGRSKVEAERLVLASMPEALVIRTSAFFGDWDDWNFVSRSLATLQAGGVVHAPDDAVVSPTYVRDLVHTTLDLLIDGEHGVWHLANVGAISWTDLARMAAARARLDVRRIERCAGGDIGWTAPRPGWSVLGSERATLLPDLDDAIARYVKSRAWERVARTLNSADGIGTTTGPGARTESLHATR
jgi:dTDP-4-dehydrorhamnose reductase